MGILKEKIIKSIEVCLLFNPITWIIIATILLYLVFLDNMLDIFDRVLLPSHFFEDK